MPTHDDIIRGLQDALEDSESKNSALIAIVILLSMMFCFMTTIATVFWLVLKG